MLIRLIALVIALALVALGAAAVHSRCYALVDEVRQREAAVERRGAALNRRDNEIRQREAAVERRGAAVERRRAAVERRRAAPNPNAEIVRIVWIGVFVFVPGALAIWWRYLDQRYRSEQPISSEMRDELDRALKELQETWRVLTDEKRKHASTRKAGDEAKAKCREMESAAAALKSDLAEARAELRDAESVAGRLGAELRDARCGASGEAAHHDLKSVGSASKSDLDEALAELRDAESVVARLRVELRDTQRRENKARTLYREVKSVIPALKSDLDEARTKCRHAEFVVTGLKLELRDTRRRASEAQAERRKAESVVTALKSDLGEARADIARLKVELRDARLEAGGTNGSPGIARQILGVAVGASRDDIIAAHKRVALTLHPDRCAGPEATRLMQMANNAREQLTAA